MGCSDAFEEKRNYFMSIISSILFSVGLWIIIDVACTNPEINKGFYSITALAILGFLLIISVSNDAITEDSMGEGICRGAFCAKVVTFLGFVMSFSTIVAGLWVLFANFVGANANPWPGIAFVLQTIFTLVSALVIRFGRISDSY